MARFAGRRHGPLLPLATMLAMGLRGPRRDPRGVKAPAAILKWPCKKHGIDVHGSGGHFLCKEDPTDQHYLCPACGSYVGGNARGQCGNGACPRNKR